MRNLDVLLRDHVKDLGRCGDVVSVAPGYARNYLLPKRLAVAATADNRRAMERRATRLAAEEAERADEIASAVERLSQLSVTTVQRADENGHLYGSVNAAAVAELCSAGGTPLDEKRVHLFHAMVHGEDGGLLATTEQMLLHVESAGPRVAPIDPEVHRAFSAIMAAHAALPRPEQAGRRMEIPVKAG